MGNTPSEIKYSKLLYCEYCSGDHKIEKCPILFKKNFKKSEQKNKI